jgi:hypothetical protein
MGHQLRRRLLICLAANRTSVFDRDKYEEEPWWWKGRNERNRDRKVRQIGVS